MTFGNPDPISNPFNADARRRFIGYFRKCGHAELAVPHTGPTYEQVMERYRALTVPDSPSPYRIAVDMTGYSGEWGRVCGDPTKMFEQAEAERKAEAERLRRDRELLDGISDEQRKLMSEFESGSIMPISRLVEV